MKQLSYFSRIAIAMVIIVIGYILIEVTIKNIYQIENNVNNTIDKYNIN